MYLWLLGRPQIQNIRSPAENIDVCINMAASILTDNKKRCKKKLQ